MLKKFAFHLALLSVACSGIDGQSIVTHTHPHRSNQQQDCPACLDHRLVQHYRARGCEPVIPGTCQCPSRYRCPSADDVQMVREKMLSMKKSNKNQNETTFGGRSFLEDNTNSYDSVDDNKIEICFFNGTEYHLGEVIPSEDVCRVCVCGYLSDGSLGIDCEAKIECPTARLMTPNLKAYFANQPRLARNLSPSLTLYCYDFYEHDKCCPRQECMPVNSRTGRTLRPRKTCQYASRQYQLGEKIDLLSIFELSNISNDFEVSNETGNHSDENITTSADSHYQLPPNLAEEISCLTCLCTEAWNDTKINSNPAQILNQLVADGVSCRKKICQLEIDQRFQSGCVPVYDEDKCCPIDFICPRTRQMSIRVRGMDSGSKLCQFEGRKYQIGSMLYQSTDLLAAPCIDCECRLPPDFTCLKRKNCQVPKQDDRNDEDDGDQEKKVDEKKDEITLK